MSNIAKAFIAAKQAFGPALKDKINPAFRSKYADLSACLEAVDAALLANGIALYQETFEDTAGVTVETVLLHESGETIRSGRLHVPASKQDPQGYGSALTYARRYSLMTCCGIAAEDDDGNAVSRKPTPAPPKPVQPTTITPTEGAMDSFTQAQQASIRDIVDTIAGHLEDGEYEAAATLFYSDLGLEDNNMARVSMTRLLDSKARAMIEAAHAAIQAKDMPGLIAAFNSIPQYAQAELGPLFTQCKTAIKGQS